MSAQQKSTSERCASWDPQHPGFRDVQCIRKAGHEGGHVGGGRGWTDSARVRPQAHAAKQVVPDPPKAGKAGCGKQFRIGSGPFRECERAKGHLGAHRGQVLNDGLDGLREMFRF